MSGGVGVWRCGGNVQENGRAGKWVAAHGSVWEVGVGRWVTWWWSGAVAVGWVGACGGEG